MKAPKLTPQTGLVLATLLENPDLSGADISKQTKLQSGSLYPILMRLEKAGWLSSEWEPGTPADLGRPRRRFYRVTAVGAAQMRQQATAHASLFGRLAWN